VGASRSCIKETMVENYVVLSDVVQMTYEICGLEITRATVYNWAKTGVLDSCGLRAKLKVKKVANKKVTTETWLREFLYEVK